MPVKILRMIPSADIEGLILAGGRGERLGGQNKASLRFNGRLQIERLWCALRPGVSRVIVSANRDEELYRRLGCEVVADAKLGAEDGGPMAGLHAVWPLLQKRYLLLLPIDAIDFRCSMLEQMTVLLMQNDVALVRLASDGREHPTCALIDRHQVTAPERPGGSLFGWQSGVPTASLAVASEACVSINTPAELARRQSRDTLS